VRYVAADLSPVMPRRARAEAKRRGVDQIEFIEADVEALPFDDASFDLCVSYTGLHCFPDPAAAVSDIARVLRPGGTLRGKMVVRRAGLRPDAFVRLYQLAGMFGPIGTSEELESWLADAGMLDVSTWSDGALAYFSARRACSTTLRCAGDESPDASLDNRDSGAECGESVSLGGMPRP
jgi:ubiquinone/menaquinone biosynthesis C-methylase UbiE